jgi:sigma-B regulation protein RsbU (phosphoserine phosphatase)
VAALLRGQITEVVAGSIFLFIGLATGSIAVTRRQRGVRIFVWLGIWSAMYGAAQLTPSPAVIAALPGWLQGGAPYATTAMTYLLIVAASLTVLELSLGGFRVLMGMAASLGLATAIMGILVFVTTGSTRTWMLYNNLLSTCVLLVLAVVVAAPALSARYLAIEHRGVLVVGTLVFVIEALYNNLSRPLGLSPSRLLDHLGFGVLLSSFGYVGLQLVFANERRLLAVEDELDIASQIQMSILPSGTPRIQHLRMSAAYRPMTAVAGDFYDFIVVDEQRVGILVADVAGHGVPAALIASMIKVAMQSVAACAQDPAAVLGGLNRILSAQPANQMISAAYLWLDTERRVARYSAAGHPPLLCWKHGKLERIESNGFLLGMVPECDYPVRTLTIDPGDRFLLYTDGVIDAESGRGEFFGDSRLEEVIREHLRRPPAEFADELLSEITRWRPLAVPQQDDITLVVIDVDGPPPVRGIG